jgi:uncharacterized protein
MFFSVKELELQKKEFNASFPPGAIDISLGTEAVQKGELKAAGRAELIEEDHGGKNIVQDIRVVGGFSTRVEMPCARCLEPVATDLKQDFDLLYRPLSSRKGPKDEVEINEAEAEIGYYQGDGISLEDVLKEQVILALPLKSLCKEDCQGLCAGCGKNLNNGKCECGEKPADPRWEALAGLKEKLKQ